MDPELSGGLGSAISNGINSFAAGAMQGVAAEMKSQTPDSTEQLSFWTMLNPRFLHRLAPMRVRVFRCKIFAPRAEVP
ncbi:hypothetical protein J437_LFUL012956 [Ladona fulva]|uniref:Uncharacterized protein n=1 Tax=Ladona fulva TaxID=123851 RepID=A0A8K0P1R6_LADFU|nr:hypothetical protein J437_LFUL012956 [Ladona fulva]